MVKLGRTLLPMSRATVPSSTLPLSDVGLTCVTPSLNSQSPASWADADAGAAASPAVHRAVARRVRNDMKLSVRSRCFRSEEHTSELQSLMRTSYAVFCLKKKPTNILHPTVTRMFYSHLPTYISRT